MSRYRTIHCKIWNDDKFPFLSEEAKLVFFHLLTTPMSTPFGFFKASMAALADESRMNLKGYAKGFKELLAKGFMKYDERAFSLLLRAFLKYNKPQNFNVLKSWAKIYSELPLGTLNDEFLQLLKESLEPLGKGFLKVFDEWFPKPSSKGMPIQEQEQEQYLITCGADDLEPENLPPFREIVSYLNEKTRKTFSPRAKPAIQHISARWRENYSIQDFKTVVDNKCAEWMGTEHEKFLRPETLFGNKFDGYLNQKTRTGPKLVPKPEPWLPDVSGAYPDEKF